MTTPGEQLKAWARERRLFMGDLAESLQCSATFVSDLYRGRAGISKHATMAGQLIELGCPPETALALYKYQPPVCKHETIKRRPLLVNREGGGGGREWHNVCVDCGEVQW